MSRSAELHVVAIICAMLRLIRVCDKSHIWLFCASLHDRGMRCFADRIWLRPFDSVLCSGEKKVQFLIDDFISFI